VLTPVGAKDNLGNSGYQRSKQAVAFDWQGMTSY